MKNAMLDEAQAGIKIARRNINNQFLLYPKYLESKQYISK